MNVPFFISNNSSIKVDLQLYNSAKIASVPVVNNLSTTITDGQVISYDASENEFVPTTVSGGSLVNIPSSTIPNFGTGGVLVESQAAIYNQTSATYEGGYVVSGNILTVFLTFTNPSLTLVTGGGTQEYGGFSIDIDQLPSISLGALNIDKVFGSLGAGTDWPNISGASTQFSTRGVGTNVISNRVFELFLGKNNNSENDFGVFYKVTINILLV